MKERTKSLAALVLLPLLLAAQSQAFSCGGGKAQDEGRAAPTNSNHGPPEADGGQTSETTNKAMNNSSNEQPGRVAEGMWGGMQILMEVSEDGARIEYDCAHGTIDGPLRPDSTGRFEADGTHVRESPGPIRVGLPRPVAKPAKYSGRVEGKQMSLTVTLVETSQTFGTFTLTEGVEGRLRKCR